LAETIRDVTSDLVSWIESILPDASTTSRPLGEKERKAGIDVRLVRAAPRAVPRTAERPSIVDLDYLITAQMPDAASEQNAIVELLFAAMERKDFEIINEGRIADLCTALGLPIAAGFLLRTCVVRQPKPQRVQRVREPLIVHTAALGVVEGRVVGAEDIPVANALVSAVGLNRSVQTDRGGFFRMAGVPGGSTSVALTASARGFEVQGVATAGRPVVLRLPLEV
jgi:hypothetical protein